MIRQTFPGNSDEPAEFEIDNPVPCASCGVELDPDQESDWDGDYVHLVNSQPTCLACVPCCPDCGEFAWDKDAARLGPAVRMRRWESDGRIQVSHAICAANWHIHSVSGEEGPCYFDSEEESREEIARMLGVQA